MGITKKMKVFAGLVASALAAPAPVIIGGKNASDGQFPHQVTLKRSSGSHYCGGSIINTNKVMCAAHCRQSTNSWTAVPVPSTSPDKDKTRVVPLNCHIHNTMLTPLITIT